MIVQCPDCSSRYQLDPARVPPQKIRVRCPNCRYVFALDGTSAVREAAVRSGASTPLRPVPTPVQGASREHAPAAVAAPAPVSAPVAVSQPVAPRGFDLEIERHHAAAPKAPVAPRTMPEHEMAEPAASAVTAAPAPVAPAAAVAAPPLPAPELDAHSTAQKKARRLARALVSDILVYNRDLRDKALAEGTLVQLLGHEIKKSYELFKERAGSEVENPRVYFVEALNDILADGQKVF